ncbi:Aurora kinase C [Tritrichomonas foetus]|uniref:Aurora kinase C n=1 Tax=Tritrichomonas foetus TaxID=1144522 RepID=A0A1J4JUY5_9EUKA|nr:Aurora kinase C [Tritrichomonas foetus]|eukprot:OHT02256.1 Aurora kinase C [Tritrichomonas foetus]
MFQAPSLQLPYEVRHYILNSEIGKGGFGRVYRAISTHYIIDYEFAVKVMRLPDTMDENYRSQLTSFESEVNALKQLDHMNVIRLYDYFREDNLVFLVLEYCPNGTLEERVSSLSFYEKVKVCHDVVVGLQYCHKMSFAHRDIKTSNILFDANNRIKIVDFGLSEFLYDANQKINKREGSLYYISPEITLKRNYSPFLSDIWAVGVLIYQVFEESYPFIGASKDEIFKNIRNVHFTPRKLPYQISCLVKQTLVRNPDQRMSLSQMEVIFHQILVQRVAKSVSVPPKMNAIKTCQIPHLPNLREVATVNGNMLTNNPNILPPVRRVGYYCPRTGIVGKPIIGISRSNLDRVELKCIRNFKGTHFTS